MKRYGLAYRLSTADTVGGQEVKGQGHTTPKLDLEAWRMHHARPLQSFSSRL